MSESLERPLNASRMKKLAIIACMVTCACESKSPELIEAELQAEQSQNALLDACRAEYRNGRSKAEIRANIRANGFTDSSVIEQCFTGGPEPAGSGSPVVACIERGVAYFKEIGSYPTLQSPPNTGQAAETVARERCQRTTTAF